MLLAGFSPAFSLASRSRFHPLLTRFSLTILFASCLSFRSLLACVFARFLLVFCSLHARMITRITLAFCSLRACVLLASRLRFCLRLACVFACFLLAFLLTSSLRCCSLLLLARFCFLLVFLLHLASCSRCHSLLARNFASYWLAIPFPSR